MTDPGSTNIEIRRDFVLLVDATTLAIWLNSKTVLGLRRESRQGGARSLRAV